MKLMGATMHLDFTPVEIFRGTRILRQANNVAYAYETDDKAVDADGAPNCYYPDDIGLDKLANSGYPKFSWRKDVLAVDLAHPSKPFAQPAGQFKGYFVAMTALRHPGGVATDTATYVDARSVPFVVIPSGFDKLPHAATSGDVGFATHLPSGKTSAFIVGDAGGGDEAKLGECSIALFAALGGINPDPRNGSGVPDGKIQYILFPGSRKVGPAIWPRTQSDIDAQVTQLLSSTPGISSDDASPLTS
jgi:hypothetical protein